MWGVLNGGTPADGTARFLRKFFYFVSVLWLTDNAVAAARRVISGLPDIFPRGQTAMGASDHDFKLALST